MASDALTRLLTPRAFRDAAAAALRAVAAHGGKASVALFDLDGLGAVNLRHGRVIGDAVLGELADLMRVSLRNTDVCGRVGDDELAVVLLDCPLEHGLDVAERLAASAASHGIDMQDGAPLVRVTLSGGVAAWPEHGTDADALLGAAGRALAHVKTHGRDGVSPASPPGADPLPPTLAVDRFVGRDADRDRLRRRLDAAMAGDPSVVFVVGEAGVGKTSIVRQLEATVRLRGGSLVAGHCTEGDVRAPYAVWAQVLAGAARLGGVARRDWRELPRLVPALGAGDARAGHGDKFALFEETATFLQNAAAARPLVLLLDDVQWADPGTWDLLEYVAPTLHRERILLVVTLRSDAPDDFRARLRRLVQGPRAHELTLARLTRDEVRRWITTAFHGQDVGHELLAFLYGHTEGNPLFVVQVLRALYDEGAVWHDGAAWRWRPVDELRLPVAVNDLITRRMARLSASTRAHLASCAVIGREFDVELAAAVGDGDAAALQRALDEGVRAGVLHPTVLRRGERYAFTHATLAAMLRAGLPPRRLRLAHERVARALEHRTPDAAAEIAAHYDRAGARAEAFRYALLAAERAGTVYAQREAMDYLRVAERHAASALETAEVQSRLADAAEQAGEYEHALEAAARALEHFSASDNVPRVLALHRLAVRVRGHLGAPARQTLDECGRLVAAAAEAGADEERAHVLAMASRLHSRLGDADGAVAAAEEGAAIAERLGDPRLLAAGLTRLGVCVEPAQPDRAAGHYRRALELYRAAGDSRGQAHCHNNLGIVFARRGEVEYAERELTTAITLGRTIGSPDLSGLFTLNLGVISLRCGAFDRARELIGESLAQFAAVKNSERQLFALLNLAHIDREQGAADTAAELYEAAESLASRIGQADVEIGAAAGRALALAATGHGEAAAAAAATAIDRGEARPDWFQGRELVERLVLGRLCDAGDAAAALDRFERTLPLAEAADLYSAAWLTAEVAPALRVADAAYVRNVARRYAVAARRHGYAHIGQRCAALAVEGGSATSAA